MMSSINDSKFLYDDIKHQTELNNDIITKGGLCSLLCFLGIIEYAILILSLGG